jgi:hypothetical protein
MPQDWQTALLIINPPTLNYSVLAEVLNLQARREAAGRGQSDSVTDRSSRTNAFEALITGAADLQKAAVI